MNPTTADAPVSNKPIEEVESVVIRFAGDSGDGMQLTGTQFTNTSALVGNDISTLPDFPAEIRAPAGSLAGVSGYQLMFSSQDIHTPGDSVGVLVAMNPAALKTNLADLEKDGILILNSSEFIEENLVRAGYTANPIEDGSLAKYRLYSVPVTKLLESALKENPLPWRQKERSKNFFALGLLYWLYDRPMEPTIEWLKQKFSSKPDVLDSNLRALKAGYFYGDTVEGFETRYRIRKAPIRPGTYRKISGNEAIALGLMTGARKANKTLFLGSYPITPASDILHELSKQKRFGVKTFQAEDEIAAIGSAIGAAFGGSIGVTASSGPGIALKGEFMGLAVSTELPVIIVNVQRAGPSTGLPTKTEQADLLMAMYGRNGECPMVILAAATPSDCFKIAFEAVRISTKYMMPVMILTDGYLANGAEPWRIPDYAKIPELKISHPTPDEAGTFMPFRHNEQTLARPWALPGTPGLQHRIGGLEKADVSGSVSYDPLNHEHMVHLRKRRVDQIANDIPDAKVYGDADGDILVVGWGSTYGAIVSAIDKARADGIRVSSMHLRHLNPMPKNVGDVLKRFKHVVCPEMNLGQLSLLLRARWLIDVQAYSKVQGKPFKISEIYGKIREIAARNGGQ